MSVNETEAFGLEEFGTIFKDSDGNALLYLTSYNGNPQGLVDAPLNSWVFTQDEQKIYRKVSAGVNGWQEFVANVAESIVTYFYFDPGQTNTTSNGWVVNHLITTPILPAGDYKLEYTHLAGQSDEGKNVGTQVQWREGTSGSWIEVLDTRDGISVDDTFTPRTGFTKITVSSDSVIQVRDRVGQTDEGGTGRIKDSGFSLIKVEDLS